MPRMTALRRTLLVVACLLAVLPAASIAQPKAASETVYVTKTGEKYHRESCRHLAKSKISISLDDAKKRYTACSVCRPPK
jgi:hypothetical protein